MLRAWNYFPSITGIDDMSKDDADAPQRLPATSMMECYHAFCLSRHQALKAFIESNNEFPAGSAIGTNSVDVTIYFIGAKKPGIQIENPLQVSAFQYPSQYGPRSPSFSRAVTKHWVGDDHHLYISGSASIVGYESLHKVMY